MPDGIRVERIAAVLPALKVPATVMNEVGQIAEGNILDNINTQRQGDGSPIKANAPSTLERKRRLGRGTRSLIDEFHRFVRGNKGSWRWKATTKGQLAAVEITPTTVARGRGSRRRALSDLVRWVQEKGYVGWFALSDDGRDAIRDVFRKWIRREFRRAAAKPGKRTRR